MGEVVVLGGVSMLGFVATKKGFQYRWYAVILYLIIFAGVAYFQIRQANNLYMPGKPLVMQMR